MKMSAEEIAAGWEMVGRHNASPLSEHRMYTPLGESVDSFVRWAQSPQERINLGIARIDTEMRGIAPGENRHGAWVRTRWQNIIITSHAAQ